ncbi:MAG: pectate lyase, partial [Planctomycetes bacterium]|nr:pectate lyase [Planctomycetota bacterium]
SNDADFARGMPLAGGFGTTADVPGKYGKAMRIAEKGGHVHYRGGSNFNPHRGTLRMFVKGSVWQDETPRWLFDARGADRIGILRDKTTLSLVFNRDRRTEPPIAKLDLPIKDVTTDEWHSVVASWDRDAGVGSIALDGRCVTGKMKFPDRHSPVLVFYVGGGFSGRAVGINLPGLEIDDLVIYDLPLSVLQAEKNPLPKEDQELLVKTEKNARKCLNFVADLQRWGGWQTLYTWPTLIGSSAQDRQFVDFPEAVGNDKSHASPYIAARFLYAYEVLGDYRFFEVALKTADLLLAAQDPRGFWVHGYRMTVSGIKPAASERHVKLQDSVQSHPIFFLSYLYRLTGDERTMAALKRAGEFYLKAQNP